MPGELQTEQRLVLRSVHRQTQPGVAEPLAGFPMSTPQIVTQGGFADWLQFKFKDRVSDKLTKSRPSLIADDGRPDLAR
jgi:hypothetical protein